MSHKRSFDSNGDTPLEGPPNAKKEKPNQHYNQHNNNNNNSSKPYKKTKYREWNFEVDYNDHFETPPVAYADLKVVLDVLCTKLGKSADQLVIYDPYWCKGNMVNHLAALGYTNVINKNRDFYNDIRCKQIPAYDILVTNPPYSGEHKVKLLQYLSSRAEPFALLLPAYTATKSYWRDFTVGTSPAAPAGTATPNTMNSSNPTPTKPPPSSSSSSSTTATTATTAAAQRNCFYLMPPDYYEYLHPEGTGKDLPPFYSCWFLGGLPPADKRSVTQRISANPRRALVSSNGNSSGSGSAGSAGAGGGALKRLPFATLTTLDSVDAMVRMGIVTAQRPNPKLRKKLKSKMMNSGK